MSRAAEGVKIYVLFYARESDEPMKGIMGHFQNKLQYWHCEIAFPLECFDQTSLPPPPLGVPRDSLIWAYGIMNQTRETFPNGQVKFQNKDRIVIDPDLAAPPMKSSQRGYIQIDAGTLGVSNSCTLLDEIDSTGAPIKAQYKISKCTASRWRPWAKHPLTSWPSGKQAQGPAEVRVREDGLVTLVTPGTAFGKHRTFSRPNYVHIAFVVPWEAAAKAVEYFSAQVGKQYDHMGIKRSMFWPGKHSLNMEKLYCVNMVVTALQQAGIARGDNPNGLTTDDLYRTLKSHPGTKVKALLPFNEIEFLKEADAQKAMRSQSVRVARKGRHRGKKERRKRRFKGSTMKMQSISEMQRNTEEIV